MQWMDGCSMIIHVWQHIYIYTYRQRKRKDAKCQLMDGWMSISVEANHTISPNAGVSQYETRRKGCGQWK
ncbi:hypothetical protein AB4K20DRAFT_1896771 [Rhizopus microsporus]